MAAGKYSLRAWRYEIARQQIEIQNLGISNAILARQRKSASQGYPQEIEEEVRQLQIQLAQVGESLRQLNARHRRKSDRWDALMIRLWNWAIRERFDSTD